MPQNINSSLETFEAIASKSNFNHKQSSKKIVSLDAPATSLISMTKSAKQRYTEIAKKHQLSLSVFVRIALEEYIQTHSW